jgi:NADPH:quinone reductase-like Zn-dependent oxidoreductase
MKAALWTAYGPPESLRYGETAKPVPADNELLIKIFAATVTAGDCEMRSLKMPLGLGWPMRLYNGLRRPRRVTILGQELAGVVEAVGPGVRRFQVGDEVFAATGFTMGAYAQYVCLPETSDDGALALKPANMSFAEAATVPLGGLESLHFLRQANIRPGEKVLINGAGGSIGTYGVQIARQAGVEVTAVDSAEKLTMLRELGADHVIDYRQQDFWRSGRTYDVIFDVIGKSPYAGSLAALNEDGRLLLANPGFSQMARAPWTSRSGRKRVITGASNRTPEDLRYLQGEIEAGKIRSVIDRRYPLEQIVAAHRYVETGQKLGNLVITIPHDN